MNPNETSVPPSNMPPMGMQGKKEKNIGALIGIIVIIAIIIIGGLYFWGERIVNDRRGGQMMEGTMDFQPAESASSEIADIEADLSATELDNLDQELNAINQELGI